VFGQPPTSSEQLASGAQSADCVPRGTEHIAFTWSRATDN
jgi:hypothetical protein